MSTWILRGARAQARGGKADPDGQPPPLGEFRGPSHTFSKFSKQFSKQLSQAQVSTGLEEKGAQRKHPACKDSWWERMGLLSKLPMETLLSQSLHRQSDHSACLTVSAVRIK